jgi:DNA-binding transcriptional ArsR family regulator
MTKHQDLDRLFHALADQTRRAIVMRLSRGPASVSELAKPFTMAMPTLLEHIRVLETSRLIDTEKHGRVRTCTVRPEALGVTEAWLAQRRAVWEARLDRLDDYVLKLHAGEKRHGRRKT